MKKYDIAIIPGDGTGPEVVNEGIKVLKRASDLYDFELNLEECNYGGERYLESGKLISEEEIEELKTKDAIYLGAIGHPDVKSGILEKGILLRLRFALDQYINLRPIILYPGVESPLKNKGADAINFVVVRENTEGLYTGSGGFLKKGTPDEVAVQESINTRKGVERCLRFAFEYCQKRNKKKKLTLCAKTNVLTYASDLWERTFYEVAEEYPDVTADYGHVDAVSMLMIEHPENFDVIVTNNIFGDIITDMGAVLQGGIGIAGGGNLNPEGVSMFEPIGGTAPDFTGTGKINPLAAISAAKMMLNHLGEEDAGQAVEDAIKKAVKNDIEGLGAGEMGYTTSEVGDLVRDYL